ncbi:hypothetical protein DMENIID0001_122940 [Sergentomyia squamirostris]
MENLLSIYGILLCVINISLAIPELPIFALPAGSLGAANSTQAVVKESNVPIYSNSYLPALMQLLQHNSELMQYEPLQPPHRTTTTQRPATTTPTTTRRTTTKWPGWLQQTTTAPQETTPPHRPGYFSPERPPQPVANKRPQYAIQKPEQSYPRPPSPAHQKPGQTYQKPEQTYERPVSYDRPSQTAIRPTSGDFFNSPDANKQFYSWFFQSKTKSLQPNLGQDLQLLDPLPKALLHDIEMEPAHLPAVLDEDNVKEFLKVYDDQFGRNVATTGKKKVPPTKPYVEMVVLYDLLKREAKALMLNKFTGYTEEILKELQMTSQWTGDKQLLYVLKKTVEHNDVTRSDIVVRLNSMIKDLENPHSITTKTVSQIPPLQFAP